MNPIKPKKMTGKMFPPTKSVVVGGTNVLNWEMRPGGMLVQQRNSESNQNSVPTRSIRVRVKYLSCYHEIHINSQASFGELKKMVAESTGLHIHDQKLIFKGKDRESKSYLDVSGVKDGSKLVLIEDVLSRERRCLELRRSAAMEKALKAIAEISSEVDKLVHLVSVLELKISKGEKVEEKELENLTELLMMQVIKLDGIAIDGDLKSQRRIQVKRVQKHIETLDRLKIQVSDTGKRISLQQHQQQHVQQKRSNGQVPIMQPQQQIQVNSAAQTRVLHQQKQMNSGAKTQVMQQQKQVISATKQQVLQLQKQMNSDAKTRVLQQQHASRQYGSSGEVVLTTNWETFDSSGLISTNVNPNNKHLNWELFE